MSSELDRIVAGAQSPGWGVGEGFFTAAVGCNDRALRVLRVRYKRPRGEGEAVTAEVRLIREWTEVHRGSVYTVAWQPLSGGAEDGEARGLLGTGSNDKLVRITW